LHPGFLEHLRLSPRATFGPGARVLDFFLLRDPAPTTQPGRGDGSCIDDVVVLTFTKRRWWRSLHHVSDGKVTTEVYLPDDHGALLLSEWLAVNGCTGVAMEATGIDWKPVWHILDDGEL
jgi:hypothetical protein